MDIADQLSVEVRTYASWERDERMIPISCLVQLASIFQVSTDYILGIETPFLDISMKGAREKELFTLYRTLSDDAQAIVLKTIRIYAADPFMQRTPPTNQAI